MKSKKAEFSLESLIDESAMPSQDGVDQRGAGAPVKVKLVRPGEKKLSVKLDGETYRKLAMAALQRDLSHQDLIEEAIRKHLNE